MSYMIVPSARFLQSLPAGDRRQLFGGGHVVRDLGKLRKYRDQLEAAATQATSLIKSSFSDRQRRDFNRRAVVAVIADGATLHSEHKTEEQRRLQEIDGHKAFELGRALARQGWRVALPGYEGLCESVIDGVCSIGGDYIVAMTRRSVNYGSEDLPLLPQNRERGLYAVTNSVAESKSILFAVSDSFVYLPGGVATFDVLSDHFVLKQTGRLEDYRIAGRDHRQLITLNDDGFYHAAHALTDHIIKEGFADEENRSIIQSATSIADVIERLSVLRGGGQWPRQTHGEYRLYMPSKAITLASRLSRTSVMHQIRPVAPKDLKEELARARYMPPYTGEIDPAVEDILCRTTCAVYLGARKGNDPRHLEAARATGALLRELGIAVIYGGAMKGNMGALADAYLGAESEHPSRILAVTPFGILLGEGTAANEGFHPGLTLTIAVPGMQERKMFMTGLSDFTLMLSGGWGSIDEKLEELRLALMNVTTKKMIIFNVGGYWDGFSKLFDEAIRRGYMKKGDLEKITVVNSVRELRHVIMKEIRQSTHPEPTLH